MSQTVDKLKSVQDKQMTYSQLSKTTNIEVTIEDVNKNMTSSL